MERVPSGPMGAWAWAWRPVLLCGVIVAACAARVDAVAAPDEASLLRFEQAELLREGERPRNVALPHTWALDGLPARGSARYRIDFELERAPAIPWALGAARLS